MKNQQQLQLRNGFTLVEILVVIAVILILAAVVFSSSQKAISRANSVNDTNTMRNIYATIPIYAADNNDFFPGPCYTGVKAEYRTSARGRLANYIAPYLGHSDPKEDEFIPAMAYTWQKTAKSKSTNCAYLRDVILTDEDDEDSGIMPFGHPLRDDDEPKTMSSVMAQIDPARTWAITDLDQLHPDLGGASWVSDIPETMSHGKYRIAIFFDGHAGQLDVENNPR